MVHVARALFFLAVAGVAGCSSQVFWQAPADRGDALLWGVIASGAGDGTDVVGRFVLKRVHQTAARRAGTLYVVCGEDRTMWELEPRPVSALHSSPSPFVVPPDREGGIDRGVRVAPPLPPMPMRCRSHTTSDGRLVIACGPAVPREQALRELESRRAKLATATTEAERAKHRAAIDEILKWWLEEWEPPPSAPSPRDG